MGRIDGGRAGARLAGLVGGTRSACGSAFEGAARRAAGAPVGSARLRARLCGEPRHRGRGPPGLPAARLRGGHARGRRSAAAGRDTQLAAGEGPGRRPGRDGALRDAGRCAVDPPVCRDPPRRDERAVARPRRGGAAAAPAAPSGGGLRRGLGAARPPRGRARRPHPAADPGGAHRFRRHARTAARSRRAAVLRRGGPRAAPRHHLAGRDEGAAADADPAVHPPGGSAASRRGGHHGGHPRAGPARTDRPRAGRGRHRLDVDPRPRARDRAAGGEDERLDRGVDARRQPDLARRGLGHSPASTRPRPAPPGCDAGSRGRGSPCGWR